MSQKVKMPDCTQSQPKHRLFSWFEPQAATPLLLARIGWNSSRAFHSGIAAVNANDLLELQIRPRFGFECTADVASI